MRVFGRENVERYAENLKENDWNQNRENNLLFKNEEIVDLISTIFDFQRKAQTCFYLKVM